MGAEIDKLAGTISTTKKDTDYLAEDTFPDDQSAALLIAPIDSIKATTVVKVYARTINGVMTVAHPIYGRVGDYPVFVPMVLGHVNWGVLGEAYLPEPNSSLKFPLTFPLEFEETYVEYSRELLHTYTS